MALVRFDPFRGFENLSRKMNEMMGEFEKGVSFEYGSFAPRVDISEDEKKLYVSVEIPGIKKDEVKITINEDRILCIKGEKKREDKSEDKDKTFIRVERAFGSFTRTFMLPDNIKTDSIDAKYENGVLRINFEKKEPEMPKEVAIEIK